MNVGDFDLVLAQTSLFSLVTCRRKERVRLNIQRHPCFVIVLSKKRRLRCCFPEFVVFILCAVIKGYPTLMASCC